MQCRKLCVLLGVLVLVSVLHVDRLAAADDDVEFDEDMEDMVGDDFDDIPPPVDDVEEELDDTPAEPPKPIERVRKYTNGCVRFGLLLTLTCQIGIW